jgi:hypothetical protein
LLAEFKLRLKDDMLNASFRAKQLAWDDYDRYFRDSWFEIQNGVVLMNGANPVICAEGLRKYKRRLKDTFKRVGGVDVDFRIAEAKGNDERTQDTADPA